MVQCHSFLHQLYQKKNTHMFYEVINLTHQFFLKTKIKPVTFLVEAWHINLKTTPCYRDRHFPANSRSTAMPTPAITFMAQYGHKQAHLYTDKEYFPWWWVHQHWESGFSHPTLQHFAYIWGNKVKKIHKFYAASCQRTRSAENWCSLVVRGSTNLTLQESAVYISSTLISCPTSYSKFQ